VDGLNEATGTIEDIKAGIAATRPHVVYTQEFSSDPAGRQLVDAGATLKSQGLAQHGMMLHCRVDPTTCVEIGGVSGASPADALMTTTADSSEGAKSTTTTTTNMRRVIDKNGQIKYVPSNDIAGASGGPENGFRKGMMALRDIKRSWTLAEFSTMNSQFEFKVQRQVSAVCPQVSLDTSAISDFQAYCAQFQFKRKRMAFLYGKFEETAESKEQDEKNERNKRDGNDKYMDVNTPESGEKSACRKAVVEAIYEPPQQVDSTAAEGFVLEDDPMEETVEQMAEWLGLKKVGWIFCHEPSREKGFVMTSAEVIMAAEFQLEAAEGVNQTPFVTVKVAPGLDGNVCVEAFQVSQQCMAMVAEEALEVNVQDPKLCTVNETFTVIQEGKESPTVENNFFLTVVPIVQHTSEVFVSDFPKLNRDLDTRVPNHDALKKELSKAGTAGWNFEDRLADLNLLLYLTDYLDKENDMPRICASVVNRETMPLDDGYKLIIKSLAGMDGSY